MEKLHTKEHERLDKITREQQEKILKLEKHCTTLEKNYTTLLSDVQKLHKLVQEKLKTPIHTETVKEVHKLNKISKTYDALITTGENIICIEDIPWGEWICIKEIKVLEKNDNAIIQDSVEVDQIQWWEFRYKIDLKARDEGQGATANVGVKIIFIQ
jgi:hypothetical protein